MKNLILSVMVISLSYFSAAATFFEPFDIEGIKAAIAQSQDGDTIYLPDGILSFADVTQTDMASALSIDKNITLSSKSGDAKDVTIDLGGTGHGFTLNAASAKIKGVIFTSSSPMNDSSDLTLPRFVNVIQGTLDSCVFNGITIGGSKSKGSHLVSLAANGVIENCRFENIISTASSLTKGAVYVNGGTIRNTKFISCNTRPAPVSVISPTADVIIEDSSFTDIDATGTQGALYGAINCENAITTISLYVKRTRVANNIVLGSAGAIYLKDTNTNNYGPTVFIEDSTFDGNHATLSGSIGVLGGDNQPSYTCDRCTFVDNVGKSSGVIGTWNYSYLTFRNCLIKGNIGESNAGVAGTGTDYTHQRWMMENCTVTGNKTLTGPYHGIGLGNCGLKSSTANQFYIKNSIIYGNGNNSDDTQIEFKYPNKITYTCYPGAVEGNTSGNIFLDPQLNEDGSLKYSSPCLDAGTDLSATAGTTDLVGTSRPQNATNKEAPLWDMGAFEMMPNTAKLEAAVIINDKGSRSVTVRADASGTNLSDLQYDWTVTLTTPSGVFVSEYNDRTQNELILSYLEFGVYSFAVKVTNSDGDEASAACEETFAAKPDVCYVSKTGSATWPYDTIEKATLNIGEAIANAAKRVEISAGEYTVEEVGTMVEGATGNEFMMVVDKPLQIVGAGPEKTVFLLDGNTAAIRVANNSAEVGGFTVSGAGRTDASFLGSSVFVYPGVVSNVVVRNSEIWGSSVYVGVNGIFTSSFITNLTYRQSADNAHPLTLAGGKVEDTVIAYNETWNCGGIKIATPISETRSEIRRVKVLRNIVNKPTSPAESDASGLSHGDDTGKLAVDVFGSDFIGNEGATVISAINGNLTMTNCRVLDNKISNSHGAITITKNQPSTFINTLIAGNTGARAFYMNSSGQLRFRNCTITDNEVDSYVNAGIHITATNASRKPEIKNCIIWGNRGLEGEGSADILIEGAVSANISYSCYPVAPAENNCTSADPELRKSKNYRYYPSEYGSCYETGDPSVWKETDVDLAGNPRLRKGKVDIGVYQALKTPGLRLMIR